MDFSNYLTSPEQVAVQMCETCDSVSNNGDILYNEPTIVPDEKLREISNYTLLDQKWEPVKKYEIRNNIYGQTDTYSKKEILEARNLILTQLERENIEQYKPNLILMDSKNNTSKTMVIHAMVNDEKYAYDGNESRNRTFYIENGKIVRIKKGQPKLLDSISK